MSPWLRLARLIAPQRWRLAAACGLTLCACLLGLAGPVLVERLLVVAGQRELSALIIPALVIVAAVVMQSVAGAANGWLLGCASLHIVRDLRRRLYERIHQMPLAWFDRTPVGFIMTRLMDDVAAVQGLAGGQTLVTLLDVSTALAAAIWLGSHGWRLAAVMAAIGAVYVVVFRLYMRRIHAGTLEVRRQIDQVFSRLKQKIDGIHVVRATSGEAEEVAEFTRQISALHQPRMRVNQLGIAFSNLCLGMGGIGATLVFAVGASEVLAGRLTLGDLIAASALAGLLFTPITRLSELATAYQQASASFGRLGEILDYPAVEASRGGCTMDASKALTGCIVFDRVQFRYAPDRPVLHDVSLRIEPGTKVAIVGPTGSGKTTLMNLLLRFYEPTGGEIRLNGQSLDSLPVAWLRRHMGVVPQEAVIFRGSLADNIRYGTPDAELVEVEAAARAALVHELASGLPQGYDTLVGEGGHPLSQGERQRIALARLFCKNPSVVVLDEATSSLDRASEVAVQEALDRLLAGRTTFMIAHRLATVLSADRIIVMDRGRIIQSGTHTELLADESGLYRQLYDCQFDPLASQPIGRAPTRGPGSPAPACPHLEAVPA